MPNLYNNKFFTYLKQREEIGIKKEMNKQGVSINDQEKFKKYIDEKAEFDFWVFILLGIFIIWQVIDYIFKLWD